MSESSWAPSQHGVLVFQLCRAVWSRWMNVAVLSGALDLPGYDQQRQQYQACAWLPTKWDWVDPMKDASAEIVQIEAGLKSRSQAIAERGYDAEQVDREIAAERQRERALGLDFRRPGSPAQGPCEGGTRDDEQDNTGADDCEIRSRSPRRAPSPSRIGARCSWSRPRRSGE